MKHFAGMISLLITVLSAALAAIAGPPPGFCGRDLWAARFWRRMAATPPTIRSSRRGKRALR